MLPEAWTSFSPVRLIVGPGRVNELPAIVSGRTLIVTTRGATQRGLSARVADGIGHDVLIHDAVRSNPTISDIDHAIDLCRDEEIDWIVGLGGGSVIDVAKVLSLALADRAGSSVAGSRPTPRGMMSSPFRWSRSRRPRARAAR